MADKLSVYPEALPFYPFVLYKGGLFPPTPIVMAKGAEQHFKDIRNFQPRDTDVLLCSQMRTGTHWMHEVLSMLINQTTEYNSMGPFWEMNLEYLRQPEEVDKISGPRILSTHLPLHMLPKKHIDNGYKIVYIRRNPKDRSVSLKTFFDGKLGMPNWTWAEFFEEMIMNDTIYGGWFNYTKEMAAAIADKTANIFSLSYEELIREPKKVMVDLVKFLEVPCTDQFIDDVIEKTKFDRLKNNKMDASMLISKNRDSSTFRKGKIGDWKDWYTVAQNERFDARYNKEMEGVNETFIFE